MSCGGECVFWFCCSHPGEDGLGRRKRLSANLENKCILELGFVSELDLHTSFSYVALEIALPLCC